MGVVAVRMYGSFEDKIDSVFCAEEGGHANAIARAIRELAEKLPRAIALDHRLQREGVAPRSDWGIPEK